MNIERNSFPSPRSELFRPIGTQAPYGPSNKKGSLAQILANLFKRLRDAAVREYRIRRDYRHVSRLDDRMLKDIGLNRDLFHVELRYGRDTFRWF